MATKKMNYFLAISLVFIMMASCTSKPSYPDTFGVYYANNSEYSEIKSKPIEKKSKNYGKPSAGELGGSRMSVLSDPRFGKNHIITYYYVDGNDSCLINAKSFNEEGLIIVGESVSECELLKIPETVNGKENKLGSIIYFKVIDSWGKKNFRTKEVIGLKQKIVADNTYQVLSGSKLCAGIYLLRYKINGQELKNKFIPFFIE